MAVSAYSLQELQRLQLVLHQERDISSACNPQLHLAQPVKHEDLFSFPSNFNLDEEKKMLEQGWTRIDHGPP